MEKEKHIWTKKCPCCKKSFETSSRNAKYCSPACSKKYNTTRKVNRKKYSETKNVERLRARGHSLAVATINLLVELGERSGVCEDCGSSERLEVHHKNYNWLRQYPLKPTKPMSQVSRKGTLKINQRERRG